MAAKFGRFRFSLRTLFLVVTAICLWLGYGLHWIKQRHDLLAEVEEFLPTLNDGVPVSRWTIVKPDGFRAPGMLWFLGERGVQTFPLYIVYDNPDQLRPIETYPQFQRAQELFPETKVVGTVISREALAQLQRPWRMRQNWKAIRKANAGRTDLPPPYPLSPAIH